MFVFLVGIQRKPNFQKKNIIKNLACLSLSPTNTQIDRLAYWQSQYEFALQAIRNKLFIVCDHQQPLCTLLLQLFQLRLTYIRTDTDTVNMIT